MAKIPVTDCPAGPALDAAVAKVLGWTDLTFDAFTPVGRQLCGTHPSKRGGFYGHGRMIVRQWSADIAAAWELAETGNISLVRVKNKGWIALPDSDVLDEDELWETDAADALSGYYERRLNNVAIEPAPLAITRTYLLAHGVTEVEAPE
jgi:hypothetical protein